jgi:hypothetical protein
MQYDASLMDVYAFFIFIARMENIRHVPCLISVLRFHGNGADPLNLRTENV